MRDRRVFASGVVLGLTSALALWLLTYQVWDVFEYIGRDGRTFHPAETVRVQPWWSVPATVGVLLAGLSFSLWLLPGRRGLVQRLSDLLVARRDVLGADRDPRDDGRFPAARR
jgi:hypothetical protein